MFSDKDTDITADQAREYLSLPSGTRPRIYGEGTGPLEGQIVSLQSIYHLETKPVGRIWLSGTTVADLIHRAR